MYNTANEMAPKYAAAVCFWAFWFALPAGAQESPLRQAARLDSEHKCGEAEPLYQRALAQGPPSQALLNNLGNHYLLCGDPEKARVTFERLVQMNPQHSNANLQLARMAVERRQGARALEYLARVTDAQPATRMLHAEALHWAGNHAASLAELNAAWRESAADPRLAYLYGMTCARIGAYDLAETAFNAVLAQYPEDFEVLFNLGRAAARAGHYERARHALESRGQAASGRCGLASGTRASERCGRGLPARHLRSHPSRTPGSRSSGDFPRFGPRRAKR